MLAQVLSTMEARYRAECDGFFQSSHIFLDAQKQAHPHCGTQSSYADAHRGFSGPVCTGEPGAHSSDAPAQEYM